MQQLEQIIGFGFEACEFIRLFHKRKLLFGLFELFAESLEGCEQVILPPAYLNRYSDRPKGGSFQPRAELPPLPCPFFTYILIIIVWEEKAL